MDQNGIDHMGRCFQAKCPPTKREKQRRWELLNLREPSLRYQMTSDDIGYINANYSSDESIDYSDDTDYSIGDSAEEEV